jgi:uncharacterized protein (DUF433 family)
MKEAEEAVSRLSRGEKVQLLQSLVRDLADAFPGIERTPGVMGGAACIRETRVPVWLLEQARRLGTSEADILRNYPSLTAEDLANAWTYVRAHTDEIDEQISANERDED